MCIFSNTKDFTFVVCLLYKRDVIKETFKFIGFSTIQIFLLQCFESQEFEFLFKSVNQTG